MLHPPGFYYVKKPKRFVILSSDKSSERNLSCFFDIRKPRRMEHLQSEEPFSSNPYFRRMGLDFGCHLKKKSIECAINSSWFFSIKNALEKPVVYITGSGNVLTFLCTPYHQHCITSGFAWSNDSLLIAFFFLILVVLFCVFIEQW